MKEDSPGSSSDSSSSCHLSDAWAFSSTSSDEISTESSRAVNSNKPSKKKKPEERPRNSSSKKRNERKEASKDFSRLRMDRREKRHRSSSRGRTNESPHSHRRIGVSPSSARQRERSSHHHPSEHGRKTSSNNTANNCSSVAENYSCPICAQLTFLDASRRETHILVKHPLEAVDFLGSEEEKARFGAGSLLKETREQESNCRILGAENNIDTQLAREQTHAAHGESSLRTNVYRGNNMGQFFYGGKQINEVDRDLMSHVMAAIGQGQAAKDVSVVEIPVARGGASELPENVPEHSILPQNTTVGGSQIATWMPIPGRTHASGSESSYRLTSMLAGRESN